MLDHLRKSNMIEAWKPDRLSRFLKHLANLVTDF